MEGRLRRIAVGAFVAVLAVSAGCSSESESESDADAGVPSSSAPAAGLTATTAAAAAPIGVPADDQLRAELLADLSAAIDAMRSQPVLIELIMDEQGSPSVATIRADVERGLVDSTWVQTVGEGSEVTTLNLVLDGRAFLKSTVGEAAAAALDFVEIGETTGEDLIGSVFTGYGRVGPSLDRWLVLLEQVPFRAEIERGSPLERLTVSFDPADVVAFFQQSGLESTGGHIPDSPMVLTFLVRSGRLIGLEASGTQFHDGEALEVTASVAYQQIQEFELEIPPIEP